MVDLLKFPAQFARPGLLIMFIELAEFSQQVSIAQGMFSRQTEIRVPSVVNHDAPEIRQDTCRFDRFIPPLSMEGVERRPGGASNMEPVQLAVHFRACFIRVQHGLLPESGFQGVLEGFEAFRGEIQVQDDGAIADGRAKKRVRDLGHAFQRHEMRHIQVGGQGVESWAVLHLTRNMLRKSRLPPAATTGADFDFGLVFGDVEAKFRQVMNLPGQMIRRIHRLPRLSTTAFTGERKGLDGIGFITEFQGFPCMTLLPARRAFALLALTFGFPGEIFAGGLIRGRAVQVEQGFDGPQFSLKLSDPSL